MLATFDCAHYAGKLSVSVRVRQLKALIRVVVAS